MANAKRVDKKQVPLSSVVTISRQFLRSIRVDSDYGREDALSGYVCQGTARTLLESMAKQIISTQQRAFTWTGPYGGGKSSLALMLCSLVGANLKLRNKAKQILDLPSTSPVTKAFEARGDGWLVVPVVGKRASIVTELTLALAKAKGERAVKQKASGFIAALVSTAAHHPQGVLVVIDELGKFLEASAQEGGDDIGFFQDLAEAASRSMGKLVVVGILHQSFDAYATRLGRQSRDEWAKVQGRYVDIPLVAAADEVIELVGRAINVDPTFRRAAATPGVKEIGKAIRSRRPGTPAGITDSLARCWPLHPVTAALLGPVSKRKFGQNERSTFGFLASREPNGFAEYLDGSPADAASTYEPSRYWDYLRANLEPAILASPDGHRWAVAADAVERAEAKCAAVHVELTKTVALIEMFRNGSGLMADDAVLGVAVSAGSTEQVTQALKDLVELKILIERKHLGAYGVFAGSDFDIEGAIAQARGEIGSPAMENISALTDLQPILAKRLYSETGTMRWITRRIIRLAELEQTLAVVKTDRGSVGSFLLCLPDSDYSERAAEGKVRSISSAFSKENVLLGVPGNSARISELSLELAAATKVMKTRPELEGDSVARRELLGRIAAVKGALEHELADAFSLTKWFFRGERQGATGDASLSVIASQIAATLYPKAPHIFSELINREDPSSNSNKARKDLMYQMIKCGDQPNLGYEGFPADAGLYYTVLQAPGLHRPQTNQGWWFREPHFGERGRPMAPLWSETEKLVNGSPREVSLSEIYALWAAPPFGVRAGVMPVLALAFFLAHRSVLAMYVDGGFTPDLSEALIDEWLLDPKRIKFQYVAASQERAKFVNAVAKSVSNQVDGENDAAPLDAARGLVSMVLSLPGWTKRTATISQTAQDVRAMLLKASDPHKVLFTDLPALLKVKESDELIAKLKSVTDELLAAYRSMLQRVSSHLLGALDHTDRPMETLSARAMGVKGITGEFRLDAFATRLENFDGSDEVIEGLISLAVSKPSANWVDRDIDAALLQLGKWALEFRQAETMAPLRGRPSTRRVIGLVFGGSNRNDASGSVDISESDTPAINMLVKKLLATAQLEKREIILAAIAEVGALLVKQQTKETA